MTEVRYSDFVFAVLIMEAYKPGEVNYEYQSGYRQDCRNCTRHRAGRDDGGCGSCGGGVEEKEEQERP
jgi:rRNA maturation endonuclease Nob1